MTGATIMEFREVGDRVRNWGRWGADDRIGTLNHLNPVRTLAAMQAARSGHVVNLGLPLTAAGLQVGVFGRINPLHLMTTTPPDLAGREDRMIVSDDYLFMPLQSVTQWDGLGHVGYDDLLYNGVPASTIKTGSGSSELSIHEIAARGVAGRGVLLDIAALHGVDRLKAGHAITSTDLEAAERRQGCRVEAGDILLVRTGLLRHFTVDGDAKAYWNGEPGLDLSCPEWLHRREVAAVASDNWGVEVQQPGMEDQPFPLHCVLIRDMGMTLGEIFVLDELAAACGKRGDWTFFFSAAPLLVVGGVGSPITPLAFL